MKRYVDSHSLRRRLSGACVGLLLAFPAAAMVAPEHAVTGPAGPGGVESGVTAPPAHTVQNGCVSLSEAVERVRRRADVERVISAETRVSQGREVHYIRVMTRDGKVRTERVTGCRRE